MSATPRDPQLLMLGAEDHRRMRRLLEQVWVRAGSATADELDALAAELAADLPAAPRVRAAALVRDGHTLAQRLESLVGWLDHPAEGLRGSRGSFLGSGERPGTIGYLFPGQGVPVYTSPGAVGDRFPEAAEPFAHFEVPERREDVQPELVQMAVIATSLGALRALGELGVEAEMAVGHSMGELTALHWAGGMDEGAIMRIARSGATVTAHADAGGTMATVLADEHTFNRALEGTGAAVAAINSPTQRVLSGRVEAVEEATERARELGARVFKLRVTGAYHTPYMIDAIRDFQAQVNSETLTTLRRRVISTVTGTTVEPDEDLGSLMTRQFCQTVRFVEAATEAARDSDLLIEVGPGKMLSGLAAEFITGTPAIPIRAGAASAYGLLEVAGAAYAAGAPVQVGRLFGTASPAGQPG